MRTVVERKNKALMGNLKKGRLSKPRATSKRAKPAAKRPRKQRAGDAGVSEAKADRVDDAPVQEVTLTGERGPAAAAVREDDSMHAAADEACETRPVSSRASEAPEISISEENEIDEIGSETESEPCARRPSAPEIDITGETELDEDADAFSERDARSSRDGNQQTDVTSVSALVLKPRAIEVERSPDVAARGPERPAASRTIDRRLGLIVSAVALVLVGWWLLPMHGVTRRAAVPPGGPAATVQATAQQTAPSAEQAAAADPNVAYVALETLPIEDAPEKSSAHGVDDVARPAEHDSRLAAYKVVTLAAGQAASCRHRGDGPGPARVSVSFGSDGQVHDVRVDGTYSGTLTGECIAKRFRALPPAKNISERATTVVDVQLH